MFRPFAREKTRDADTAPAALVNERARLGHLTLRHSCDVRSGLCEAYGRRNCDHIDEVLILTGRRPDEAVPGRARAGTGILRQGALVGDVRRAELNGRGLLGLDERCGVVAMCGGAHEIQPGRLIVPWNTDAVIVYLVRWGDADDKDRVK